MAQIEPMVQPDGAADEVGGRPGRWVLHGPARGQVAGAGNQADTPLFFNSSNNTFGDNC